MKKSVFVSRTSVHFDPTHKGAPYSVDSVHFFNFGNYAVDMTGVASLDEKCTVCADCSFGELTIFIPRRFTVIPDSSTSFASLDVQGHPDVPGEGTIHLNADVSFGEIRIQYI